MKVAVDPVRCGCTGYCVKIAPMVFQLPSEGPARVIEAAPVDEHADLVKEAETVCPTNAIHVHD